MSAVEYLPQLVGPELVGLTRALGEPERDLVILAEGNTSQRLPDGRIALKASGSRMRDVTAADFVVAQVDALAALLTSTSATQADLTAALDAGVIDGRRVRGSIEALVHVAVHVVAQEVAQEMAQEVAAGPPPAFVGHTHPTAVVGLLSSVHGPEAFHRAAYSDEAVVIGSPLYVPYAQPGIALGRVFFRCLRAHVDRTGALPGLVLLANHGIVTIAPTADGVDALSEMAVKAARVRTLAYAVGGLVPLSSDSVASYVAREDIVERRANLAGG